MACRYQGRLVKGPYKPICRDGAIYFSITVYKRCFFRDLFAFASSKLNPNMNMYYSTVSLHPLLDNSPDLNAFIYTGLYPLIIIYFIFNSFTFTPPKPKKQTRKKPNGKPPVKLTSSTQRPTPKRASHLHVQPSTSEGRSYGTWRRSIHPNTWTDARKTYSHVR